MMSTKCPTYKGNFSHFCANCKDYLCNLIILVVLGTLHIHNGFYVARLHLHENSYTHLAVHEFQFVGQGAFCQVQHTHIDGCHNVCPIYQRHYWDIEVFAEYFATMHQAVGTTQDGVVDSSRPFLALSLEIYMCPMVRPTNDPNGRLCALKVSQWKPPFPIDSRRRSCYFR